MAVLAGGAGVKVGVGEWVGVDRLGDAGVAVD